MRGWRRVLTIVLIPVVAFGVYIAARTLLVVPENERAIEQVCRSTNQLRAAETELWTGVIRRTPIPPLPKNPTPEQVKEHDDRVNQTAAFVADLRRIFAQQDCDKENP